MPNDHGVGKVMFRDITENAYNYVDDEGKMRVISPGKREKDKIWSC